MKFVFFGSFHVSADILEGMVDGGLTPDLVVCNPDRIAGRRRLLTSPAVKERIKKKGWRLPVAQPEKPTDILEQLQSANADIFVVMGYPHILPQSIINIPRLGTVGVHPSLLPKYRGPSPMQSALLAGEVKTGVTLYLLDEKVDHGPIIVQDEVNITSNETNTSLEKKCAAAAVKLLIEVLPKFVKEGDQSPAYRQAGLPQDESQATYTKKFAADDAFVTEEDLAAATSGSAPEKATEIDRKIRALNPEPGAWTFQKGKRVKLLEAKIIDSKLQLTKIQQEGKTPSILN